MRSFSVGFDLSSDHSQSATLCSPDRSVKGRSKVVEADCSIAGFGSGIGFAISSKDEAIFNSSRVSQKVIVAKRRASDILLMALAHQCVPVPLGEC